MDCVTSDSASISGQTDQPKRPVGRPRSDKHRQLCAMPGREVRLMPSTGKRALPGPFGYFMQPGNYRMPSAIMVPVVPIPIPVFTSQKLANNPKFRSFKQSVSIGDGKEIKIADSLTIKSERSETEFHNNSSSASQVKKIKRDRNGKPKTKGRRDPRPIPTNKMCVAPLCGKYACFGYSGSKASFCKLHSADKPGMIDVVSRRCEKEACQKHPAFANPGERARFCKLHKSSDMVDVINRRCEHVNCNKHRVFAFPSERPRFCKVHSLPGMVDVKSRKCELGGCMKHPAYGLPGEKPIRCRVHCLPGMVNVLKLRNEETKFKSTKISKKDDAPLHIQDQISELLSFETPLKVPSCSPVLESKTIRSAVEGTRQFSKSIFEGPSSGHAVPKATSCGMILEALEPSVVVAPSCGSSLESLEKQQQNKLNAPQHLSSKMVDTQSPLNLLVQAMMADPSFSS